METGNMTMDYEAPARYQAEITYLHTELNAAYNRLDLLESYLDDCRAFLGGYADADIDQYGVHPNTAMRLWAAIDEVLGK
jgi:hypothetical protein